MNKNLDILLDTLERLVKTRELIVIAPPPPATNGYQPMPFIPSHAMNIDNLIMNVTMKISEELNPAPMVR